MDTSTKSNFLFASDLGYIGKAQFTKDNKVVNARIYSIRIGRVCDQISNKKSVQNFAKQIFNVQRLNDVIHCVTGLYSLSLPDIGERAIYECLCSHKAFTICVLKDAENGRQNDAHQDLEPYSSDDCLSAVEESLNQSANIFEGLFSDVSSDESDQDLDDDDLKPFTAGLRSFIQNKKLNECSLVKNLLACATLERVNSYQLPGQDESIIDLQLLAVRNKYRGFSIGKHLISLILNRRLVGNYDAIVTCSDSNAIKFYEKFSFSIDPILNSKYSHIGDIWTDATKMCYIPAYGSLGETAVQLKPLIRNVESDADLERSFEGHDEKICEAWAEGADAEHSAFIGELTNMERDFKKWQKLMFSSYQFQSKIFFKFKQEILNLKANICAKDSIIEELKIKNTLLLKSNKLLQMKLDDLECKQQFSHRDS